MNISMSSTFFTTIDHRYMNMSTSSAFFTTIDHRIGINFTEHLCDPTPRHPFLFHTTFHNARIQMRHSKLDKFFIRLVYFLMRQSFTAVGDDRDEITQSRGVSSCRGNAHIIGHTADEQGLDTAFVQLSLKGTAAERLSICLSFSHAPNKTDTGVELTCTLEIGTEEV